MKSRKRLLSDAYQLVVVFGVVASVFLSFFAVPVDGALNKWRARDVVSDGVNRIDENINNINNKCNSDRLAVYKVALHTYWTRELFPKHYPDWRPPAQWSNTIG